MLYIVYCSELCFCLFSYMSFHIGTHRTTSLHGTEILWFKIIPFLNRFPEVIGLGQRICTFKIWNSSTLAISCEELTHLKRLWCWEGLGAGGEGEDRGWDGWMASLTRWMWVWVNSGSWWWTGRSGMLRFMGLQRVGHDWVTELNWTEPIVF